MPTRSFGTRPVGSRMESRRRWSGTKGSTRTTRLRTPGTPAPSSQQENSRANCSMPTAARPAMPRSTESGTSSSPPGATDLRPLFGARRSVSVIEGLVSTCSLAHRLPGGAWLEGSTHLESRRSCRSQFAHGFDPAATERALRRQGRGAPTLIGVSGLGREAPGRGGAVRLADGAHCTQGRGCVQAAARSRRCGTLPV